MSKLCENTVGALKWGHVVLQAPYCPSRIRVQLSKEPWVRHSGNVSAGMIFLLKVLFICSIIINVYTSHNNSNILNLGHSLIYKCFSCITSHNPTRSTLVCLRHKKKLRLKKKNGFNQKCKAAKESESEFEPRFSSSTPTSLSILQELPRKFKSRNLAALTMVSVSCTELKWHKEMLQCLLNEL